MPESELPASPARFRVVLADDHAATLEDVRRVLEEDGRFVVVAGAPDAAGAISATVREQPDLCLLDVGMPGGGIAAAWEIHARLPLVKVVMLTEARDDATVLAALRAGATGYLLKDMDLRRLPRALEAVLDGEAAIPRALVSGLVDELRDRSSRRREVLDAPRRLTSREWQVAELVREGLTTAQIARRLVVSPVTVRTHLQHLMRKLGASTREELAARLEDDRWSGR